MRSSRRKTGRTEGGCARPFASMEAASSAMASAENTVRSLSPASIKSATIAVIWETRPASTSRHSSHVQRQGSCAGFLSIFRSFARGTSITFIVVDRRYQYKR